MSTIEENETQDAILGGLLKISQPARGYRFSLDSILLARFARPSARARVLELGAGCGVVSILVAHLYRPRAVTALEIQPQLARFIAHNAERNGLTQVVAVVGDLRSRRVSGLDTGSFDYVLANPPYRVVAAGRQSPNPARRMARDESAATLKDFVAAASRYCRFGGRVAIVLAASRLAEQISELRAHRLEPKRLRMVHPRSDRPASVVLVEAMKGAGVELKAEPPLCIYQARGVYTEEASALLGGSSLR